MLVEPLEIIGVAILVGVFLSLIVTKLKIPSVAAYVVVGMVMGQSILNVFSANVLKHVYLINEISLGIIAFLIGEELRLSYLKKFGKTVFFIVICEAMGAFMLVFLALQLFFHNLPLALLLGSIASATAPAATVMVIEELRARGDFTRTLLSIVAIDDAISLLIFTFASFFAKSLLSHTGNLAFFPIIKNASFEILGSVAIGLTLGTLMSFPIKKINSQESTFLWISGVLFLIIGFSEQFHLSSLLASMTFGITLTNLCPKQINKTFEIIKQISPPLFVAFFVTAGAHLRLDLIPVVGVMGIVYTISRILGKVFGARLGANLGHAQEKIKKYIGFGLLSQVGVAIGLSLLVVNEFSEYGAEGVMIGKIVINLLLATTIFTEIFGPIMTRIALIKSGEAYNK